MEVKESSGVSVAVERADLLATKGDNLEEGVEVRVTQELRKPVMDVLADAVLDVLTLLASLAVTLCDFSDECVGVCVSLELLCAVIE